MRLGVNGLLQACINPMNQGVRPQGFSAFPLASVFRLDSLRVKSQNYSSRDASPKRSVFHPTY